MTDRHVDEIVIISRDRWREEKQMKQDWIGHMLITVDAMQWVHGGSLYYSISMFENVYN